MVRLGPTEADMLKSTFFLQLEPIWSSYKDRDGMRSPTGYKVVSTTKARPQRPRGGTVTVKLTVSVPKEAFLPLRPEAEIVIPANLIHANLPVVVEATEPEGDGSQ